MMAAGRLIAVALGLMLAAFMAVGPVHAQGQSPTPILTVEPERLLTGSERGKEMQSGFERETETLTAENRSIEKELIAEEKALTQLRKTLAPDAFSKEADAFDAKVQEIRQRQDAKSRDLIARRDAARQNFISESLPILAEIVGQRRGLVLLDRATVFLSADTVDITNEAIRRIDAAAARKKAEDAQKAGGNNAPAPTEPAKP